MQQLSTPPNAWTTKDYVTAAVALYGALLSTYTAWTKWRENRADVRVTLSLATQPVFARDALGGQTNRQVGERAFLSIMVRNHGFRNVSLPKDCCKLEARKLDPIQLPPSSTLPVTLEPGESIRLVASPEYAIGGAKGMRAIVSDQLARKYRSRWVKFDLGETARMVSMDDGRS